ncbi:SR-related and CTD-associated factor 4-like isoform X2 [Erpetoichthys calabaricus]|uniref:Vegetative cell wall protein gp1-like n=1 Tax=Erpetoichthys calabaricus TaxID=27687 RepID=A0A8C4RN76_ERPCA|nr:SR-related and CTD-associated factor 4-like isoform X2 [Erpetoichthys calabaricus]
MKATVLLMCLLGTTFAVPMQRLYEFLPQVNSPQQNAQPSQPQPMFPYGYPGQTLGQPSSMFPSQGFIRQKIPQPPGRQSIEILYPYGFGQQQMFPGFSNLSPVPPMQFPMLPNMFPFGSMVPMMPQQPSPQSPNLPPSFGNMPQQPGQTDPNMFNPFANMPQLPAQNPNGVPNFGMPQDPSQPIQPAQPIPPVQPSPNIPVGGEQEVD